MLIPFRTPAFILAPALVAAPMGQTWEIEGQKYEMRVDGPIVTLLNAQGHPIHAVYVQGKAQVVGITMPGPDPIPEVKGHAVEVDGVEYTIKAFHGEGGETLAVIVYNPAGRPIFAVLPPDPETHI
jgi:hypothetical protein